MDDAPPRRLERRPNEHLRTDRGNLHPCCANICRLLPQTRVTAQRNTPSVGKRRDEISNSVFRHITWIAPSRGSISVGLCVCQIVIVKVSFCPGRQKVPSVLFRAYWPQFLRHQKDVKQFSGIAAGFKTTFSGAGFRTGWPKFRSCFLRTHCQRPWALFSSTESHGSQIVALRVALVCMPTSGVLTLRFRARRATLSSPITSCCNMGDYLRTACAAIQQCACVSVASHITCYRFVSRLASFLSEFLPRAQSADGTRRTPSEESC